MLKIKAQNTKKIYMMKSNLHGKVLIWLWVFFVSSAISNKSALKKYKTSEHYSELYDISWFLSFFRELSY